MPVSLAGLVKGDRITIRSVGRDGAQNDRRRTRVIVTIADTAGPALKLSSSKGGKSVKTGDTLDVFVSATDSSGIRYVGWQLHRRLSGTDSVLIRAETTFVTASATPKTYLDNSTPARPPFVIDDAILPGNYAISGLALDRSGVFTRGGPTTLTLTVIESPGPKVTILSPITGDSASRDGNLTVALRGTSTVGLRKMDSRSRARRAGRRRCSTPRSSSTRPDRRTP